MPVGYERFAGDPTTQIGTGAYALKEFEVGKQSIHVKNEFYWDAGKASFDEVHIIDFADADAMINALLADQIDVANDIPSASVETVNGTDGYKVLNSEGGGWLTISMAVDQEPFTDVRVRQAMRLIVDRDAMVEQVLPDTDASPTTCTRHSMLRTSATSFRSASKISRLPRSCSPKQARAI